MIITELNEIKNRKITEKDINNKKNTPKDYNILNDFLHLWTFKMPIMTFKNSN